MYRVQKTVDKLISNEKLFDKPIFFFNKYSTVTKKKITLQIFQDCPCPTTPK